LEDIFHLNIVDKQFICCVFAVVTLEDAKSIHTDLLIIIPSTYERIHSPPPEPRKSDWRREAAAVELKQKPDEQ
jgi:hypothetical protein